MKFNATIELVGATRAIISLFDSHGEWSGSSRLDLPRGATLSLYELGYDRASQAAAVKGGSLDYYRVVQ